MGVTGIGGFFFRATDPESLGAWYKARLNVGGGCDGTGSGGAPDPWTWTTAGGATVFAPFKADTDYFAADKAFMLNLRVSGLDDLFVGLRAAGVAVETRAEWDSPETGRFARIHDPEGNAIELWEPPAEGGGSPEQELGLTTRPTQRQPPTVVQATTPRWRPGAGRRD